MIFSNPGFSGTTHLQQETAQFIPPDRWPANSPNLNPVDYCVWGLMQEGVYKTPVRDISDLKQRVIDRPIHEHEEAFRRASSTRPLINGEHDCMREGEGASF